MARYGPGSPQKKGPGGARPNSGPKPNWYKELCHDLFKKNKLAEFVADVASGKPIEEVVRYHFDVRKKKYRRVVERFRADTKVRLEAIRDLRDGAGLKPASTHELSGPGGRPISSVQTNLNVDLSKVDEKLLRRIVDELEKFNNGHQ